MYIEEDNEDFVDKLSSVDRFASYYRLPKYKIYRNQLSGNIDVKFSMTKKWGRFPVLKVRGAATFEIDYAIDDWIEKCKDHVHKKVKAHEKEKTKRKKNKTAAFPKDINGLPNDRQKLVGIADTERAVYIKTRNCFLATGDPNQGPCNTCGYVTIRPYKRGQNGLQLVHYITRGCYYLRWDERNTDIGCAGCNKKHDQEGMHDERVESIDAKYGAGTAKKLQEEKLYYNQNINKLKIGVVGLKELILQIREDQQKLEETIAASGLYRT